VGAQGWCFALSAEAAGLRRCRIGVTLRERERIENPVCVVCLVVVVTKENRKKREKKAILSGDKRKAKDEFSAAVRSALRTRPLSSFSYFVSQMRTGALSARGSALAWRGDKATPSKAMAPRRRPSIATTTSTTRTTTSTSTSSSSSTRAASAAGGSAGGAAADDDKKPATFLSNLKNIFGGGEKLDRERLKALGTGAVASYGFISNVTYGGGMAVSWVGFVKKYAVSPLASGQWPKVRRRRRRGRRRKSFHG